MTALLTDNLPLLAGSPNGIQKLRELILELAVRGKLVPQAPNDEPASELLKRIAEEKARLVAEGKFRKQKPLAEIGEEEKPFELPDRWTWSRLSEIALINPRNSAADLVEVSFVPMTLIGTRFDGQHGQEVRTWAEVKQGFTHFAEGDVGVAKITPCFENSKACVFSGLKNGLGAGTTELHIVRPVGDFLSARYVLAYLKSPQFLLVGETKMTGTAGQKRLPKDFVESNPFPLPPLAEQHRIVAKVDELMALCDRLEARQANAESAHTQLVQALLDSLTQASDAEDFAQSWQRLAEHFHTLFTTESSIDSLKQTLLQLAVMGKLVPQDANDEPATCLLHRNGIKSHPHALHGWAEVSLGHLGEILGGSTPSKANADFWNGEIPWVSPKDMKRPVIQDSEDHVSAKALAETSLKAVPPQSLLMVVRGMILAHSFPVALTAREVTINQDMKALVAPKELSGFLLMYLQASKAAMVQLVDRSSHGTCKLTSEKLWSHVVSLPPLAEQHRIVAKVDQLMALCDQLKARLSHAHQVHEHLANALVEKAVA
jgi:type I restriction enzyme S subunit